MGTKTLTRVQLVLYSFPILATALVSAPLLVVMPALYVKHTTISMAMVGSIFAISRIVDGFTDPVIGYLSDRTRSRWGRRKPWIFVGSILLSLSIWFFFRPPSDAGPAYFIVWSGLFFLAATLFSIPASAWASELSHEDAERSRIFTFRGIFFQVGALAYVVVPIVLASHYGSTVVDLPLLQDISLVAVILLPLATFAALKYVPDGRSLGSEERSVTRVLQAIIKNKLFLRYTAAYALSLIGNGMSFGLLFIVVGSYLQLAEQFVYIGLSSMFAGLIALPIWGRLVRHHGKPKVWALSMLVTAPLAVLIFFVEPGPTAFYPMLVLACVSGALQTCTLIAAPAVLCDIIDYDTMKTGTSKAANYFSINVIVLKVAVGIGAGAGFVLSGIAGYEIGAVNDDSAVFGLLMAFSLVPGILYTLAGAVFWFHPISASRQDVIRRKLERRSAQLGA